MGEQILIAPFILLRLYTMCLGDRRTVHPNVDAPVAASLWPCQPQQYVQRVSDKTYEQYVPGLGGAHHLDRVPSEFHGGRPLQIIIPAYRSEWQDTPLPCIQNSHLAPEEGQVLVCEHGLALVYPENPRVHWLFNGTYSLPSAKLHCYLMPHAQANFIGEDPCILTYEDLALMTIPAFWINASPEVYQPASQWQHPWYSAAWFSGAVPSLRDWNDWLEINFRYIWKSGSRRTDLITHDAGVIGKFIWRATRPMVCQHHSLSSQSGRLLWRGVFPLSNYPSLANK